MDTVNIFTQKVAEVEISYRNPIKPSERVKITNSKDCYELLKANWDTGKIELYEQFYVLLLNKAHRVLGISLIGEGGVSGCVVDPKRVFAIAIKCSASSIILTHSHPSGNKQPSEADHRITQKIKEAGVLLDIAVLDHVIVTVDDYYSFADEGTL